jgi:glucokinase
MTDEAAMPLAGAGPHRVPATPPGPVLALDLGASQVRAAVVDPHGRLLQRLSRPTPVADGPAAVVSACAHLLQAARARLPRGQQSNLVGLGISAVGPLDPRSGVLIEPPNLDERFRDVPLAKPLEEALQLPAFMERDTHVAALAEGAFGAARGIDDFIYLTVSTGIGGAVVTGGRLMTGPDGVAGELGHLPVEMDGPPCGCGARGHLEAISSGTGIARAAAEAVEAGAAGELATIATRIAPDRLAAVHVAVAEETGDAAAAAIMDRARRAFAAAIVGMVDVFNPERIIVGGGIALNQGDRWLDPARDAIARTAFRIPARRVLLVPAACGEDVSLVGAAPLVAAGLARAGDALDVRSQPKGQVPSSGPGGTVTATVLPVVS